jgi:TctA family transporter
VVRRLNENNGNGEIIMELMSHLLLGLQTAATLANLFYCFIGVFLGTAIGVLPGLGPTATIAMLLPVTFVLPPVTALIMLAGIYYGSQYGGSTTSILVNLPGEAASVVTTLDGYQMAKQGKAGAALAASAIGSFFAGTVATFLIAGFGPPLAAIALKFGPAEFFSLMVLGLVASVVLAQGSLLHAIGMVILGLLLGLIGTDVNSGTQRFTFGIDELADGIGFVTVAMGMFGLGEIIRNLENEEQRSVMVKKITGLWPTREDFKRMVAPILRGTIIGSALGILPGSGSILGSFAAYSIEKKVSKNRAEFGKGAIEGVAAPESANNAGAQTSFIPLLTLGIPSNPVSALMVGAMIIHGIQPGPSVLNEQPALFWGMIVSMWIGNLFLVVLNYPLIGMWVRMIMIPYRLLFPGILVFCAIGVFSLKNATFDVYLMALFGVLGYVFSKLGCEAAPMLLAFILGPLMEEYLRRAMLLSRGNPWVFVQRPISATLLALAVLAMCTVLIPAFNKTREEAFAEGTG